MRRAPLALRVERAAYRALLRFMPQPFRERFGADMETLFRRQQVRAARAGGLWSFRRSALSDLLTCALAERAREARALKRTIPEWRQLMPSFLYDLRLAARTLRHRPTLTLPLILTLGLGIGLVSAMAIVVQGVLLRPLPYPDADRLVMIWENTPRSATEPTSHMTLMDWRAGVSTFAGVAGSFGRSVTITGLDEAQRVPARFVTADFFEVAGVAPLLGRWLSAEEMREGGPAAVLVSERFWREVLGAPPGVPDRAITLADALGRAESYTIVGVMPARFDLHGAADVYVPLDPAVPWNVRNHVLTVTGRISGDVTVAAALADLAAVDARVRASDPEIDATGVTTRALSEHVLGGVRKPLIMLLAAAALLLLIAFLNVAGALLARGITRAPEIRMRTALGASRARIVTQLLAESVILAGASTVVAVSIAWLLVQGAAQVDASVMPRLQEVVPNWLTLTACAALAASLGVLSFGLGTALLSSRWSEDTLRMRGGSRRGERRTWRVLLSAEVALAFMLLVGAGLLGRSLYSIATVDSGFDPAGVTALEITLPQGRYPDAESGIRFLDDALASLAAVPGVESVGLGNLLPLPDNGNIGGPVQLEPGVNVDITAQYRVGDGGYFEALRIPLLAGRTFDESDREGAPHSAVISASLAQRLWPDGDAVGRRFLLPDGFDPYRGEWLNVIGVVADARPWNVEEGAQPMFYVSYRQRPAFLSFTGITLLVRSRIPLDAAVLRGRLSALDPQVPARVATVEERLATSVADRRFVFTVLGVFAALSLVLAATGIWGVSSFVVSRRVREMGIRLALGAAPLQVRRALQQEAMVPLVIGVLAGGALAMMMTRWIRSLLFNVEAADPLTIAAVIVTLAATCWAASYLPARRTARVDPATALRTE